MLIDARTRLDAAADLDRNVIVTAGAGTGKTRLLVDRLVHLLIGKGVPIRRVVALTFTEKAANEMRMRLAGRLEGLLALARGSSSSTVDRQPATGIDPDPLQYDLLRERYRLNASMIETRAREALELLDQALIGTIHSFAAHILRLFPVEAGVDPTFEVDTGTGWEARFAREWAAWLADELGSRASRREAWLGALARVDLATLERLALELSNYLVPLPLPPAKQARAALAAAAAELAGTLDAAARRHDGGKKNNLVGQMRDYERLLRAVAAGGAEAVAQDDDAAALLDKEVSKAATGWPDDAFAAARERAAAARAFLLAAREVDDRFVEDLVALLEPFVRRLRRRFIAGRSLTFDGLLALARDLLRAHLRPQERMKRDVHALLVDEFQDTDPVQAELLFRLAQKPGRPLRDVEDVELAPGKLFIVGDAKQSIYGFRRADIAAFDWARARVLAQGGVEHPLTTNFRSRPAILDAVNALFGRLIAKEPGLQPEYEPLAFPGHAGDSQSQDSKTGEAETAPPVELRLVAPVGDAERLGADEIREAEAEWIARWIDAYVSPQSTVNGHPSPVTRHPASRHRYCDVAVLLRALTQVHPYLEALKRHGIPYVVEGEKHFFSNPEVVDVINLLQAIENPHDRIALAGVLRSTIGGASDRTVLDLAEAGALDYRAAVPAGIGGRPAVEELYARLRELHARARRLPADALVDAVFEALPVPETSAVAAHGEQRLANLEKIRRLAAQWGTEPDLTLAAFVRRLAESMERGAEEGESPLADETLDAVRVLSIHKAKGLEFPVVILANLHGEPRARGRDEQPVAADWLTKTVGITAGGARNSASVAGGLRAARRERAEARRVLYVAMTRAKERLILSGAAKAGPRSLLELIEEAARRALTEAAADGGKRGSGLPPATTGDRGRKAPPTRVLIGSVRIPVTLLPVPEPQAPRARPPETAEREADWVGYRDAWERRRSKAAELAGHRRFTSPSRLEEERGDLDLWTRSPEPAEAQPVDSLTTRDPRPETRDTCSPFPAMVGTVCHRVLELWDFAWGAGRIAEAVARACDLLRAAEARDDWAKVAAEAEAILRGFHGTEAYRRLARCEVLGRELPVLLPQGGQAIRGVMDLLVRDGKALTIVDYKTDAVAKKELKAKAEEYRLQGDIYREAVRAAAPGEPVGFRLVFLRDGATVDL